MDSYTKRIIRELKSALSFSIINDNPKNSLAKLLSYKNETEESGNNTLRIQKGSTIPVSILELEDVTYSSLNGRFVIIADLDDDLQVWDTKIANRSIKNTSWYQELGPPPNKGLFVVDTSFSTVKWLDRTSEKEYMTFNVGANNMVGISPITDIHFLDYKLYISGGDNSTTGYIYIIDFIRDISIMHNNTGNDKYKGNIKERNDASGYLHFTGANDIPNLQVFEMCVKRDDQGNEKDQWERPIHWWGCTQSTGYSLYNGNNKVVYDWADLSNQTFNPIDWGADNRLVYKYDAGGGNQTYTIGAQAHTMVTDGNYNGAVVRSNLVGHTAAVTGRILMRSIPQRLPSTGGPAMIIGSNEGLRFLYFTGIGYGSGIGTYVVTDSFYTSFYKGEHNINQYSEAGVEGRIANFPCNDINNRCSNTTGPMSNYTNGDFNSIGPYNACLTWGAVGPPAKITASPVVTSIPSGKSFYISFMVKFNSASDSSTNSIIMLKETSWGNGDNWVHLQISSDGTFYKCPYLYFDDTGTPNYEGAYGLYTGTPSNFLNLNDNEWHHVVMCMNRTNNTYYCYADGEIWENGNLTGNNNGEIIINDDIDLFASYDNANPLKNASISNLIAGYCPANILPTNEEVRFEYNRMKAGLAKTPYLLESNVIDDIKVDKRGEYAIVCAGGYAHIIDLRIGLITEKIAAPNLNNADIRSVPGSDNPYYVLVTDNAIIQKNYKIDTTQRS